MNLSYFASFWTWKEVSVTYTKSLNEEIWTQLELLCGYRGSDQHLHSEWQTTRCGPSPRLRQLSPATVLWYFASLHMQCGVSSPNTYISSPSSLCEQIHLLSLGCSCRLQCVFGPLSSSCQVQFCLFLLFFPATSRDGKQQCFQVLFLSYPLLFEAIALCTTEFLVQNSSPVEDYRSSLGVKSKERVFE